MLLMNDACHSFCSTEETGGKRARQKKAIRVHTPPAVEYSLTEIGVKIHPAMEALQKWGEEYIDYMNHK